MNYGMIAKKNSTTRSRIRWSADNSILYFDGRALKMNEWKQFVEELVSTAEELLSQRLLFREDGGLPEVDLKVIDDPTILVNVVSQRVKQLKRGNRPLVESLEKLSNEDTALREIMEGKISYETGPAEEPREWTGPARVRVA